jgi:pyruvate kinase
VQVVQTMANIIKEMESHPSLYHKEELPPKGSPRFISDSICFNACRLAQRVEAKGIITMTYSGYTAYKIASQRPESHIYVFTSNRKILTQLNLVWGVRAFFYNKRISTDHTIADIKHLMKEDGYLQSGDVVINVASIPLEDLGGTNMLKLSYVE